jgi:hypothetical protein
MRISVERYGLRQGRGNGPGNEIGVKCDGRGRPQTRQEARESGAHAGARVGRAQPVLRDARPGCDQLHVFGTVATAGPDGAHLIVTPGTTHRYSGAAGSRERAGLYLSDEVPVYSPITAIHYRGGATCHLVTAERWIYGPPACAPPLAEPFGLVRIGAPTHAQLATPIHATLIRDAEGRRAIRIRFTSRVAISSLRGEYRLEWHEPGMAPEVYAAGPIDEGVSASYSGLIPQGRNIAAGQTLTTLGQRKRVQPKALAPRKRRLRAVGRGLTRTASPWSAGATDSKLRCASVGDRHGVPGLMLPLIASLEPGVRKQRCRRPSRSRECDLWKRRRVRPTS